MENINLGLSISDLNLSPMSLSDLENIKDVLISDFDEFWNYEILHEELQSASSKYIVAKIKNSKQIVGFAGIKTILDGSEIMNIVTRKNMRGHGIASSMLEYLINICKNEKIKKMNLEVNNQNSIAINLYKKYNFIEVGLRKKYYNNTYDAVLMSLAIDEQ